MSKRVKFGKKVNAEKRKVPNIVFGYDKTKGELFDLAINEREAEIVREIFRQYCEDEDGAMKIAQRSNPTRRGAIRFCFLREERVDYCRFPGP